MPTLYRGSDPSIPGRVVAGVFSGRNFLACCCIWAAMTTSLVSCVEIASQKDFDLLKLEVQHLHQKIEQLEAEVALLNSSPPR